MLNDSSECGGLNSSLRKRLALRTCSLSFFICCRKGIIFMLALTPLSELVWADFPRDVTRMAIEPL